MKTLHPDAPVISLSLERIKSLPARLDTWQVGFARMPKWVTDETEVPFRPLVPICRDAGGGPIGDSVLLAPGEPPGPSAIAAIASLGAMRGVRARPRRVQVLDPDLANELRVHLAECGIEVEVVERLDAIDEVIEDMRVTFAAQEVDLPVLARGVHVERLRAFAEAAIEFHRVQPWDDLCDEDLVVIESPNAPRGMACFTVLGAAGLERGLGFYASPTAFKQFQDTDLDDLPEVTGGEWMFSFESPAEWPIADSEFWETHDLPVASDGEYPLLLCLMPNGKHKTAGPEQLAFVEGLLRALATTTQDEMDTGSWSKTVETIDGPRTISLSIPAMLEAGAEPEESATTPQSKAREIVDHACETEGRLRIKLAREALRVWPDCADAWVLQADAMPDLSRSLELWRLGVEAGERALGPRRLKEYEGHFWGMLDTRPYMRARSGLAGALWEAGEHEEAIAHWHGLLRLNPDDNQGIRHELVPRLLEVHRDAEAKALLETFDEDISAALTYSAVLLEFRRSGAAEASQVVLNAAMRWNPNVPMYLTGRMPMNGPLPESYSRGSNEEARIASELLFEAWNSTDGAIEWLGRVLRPPKKERRQARAKAKGKQRR